MNDLFIHCTSFFVLRITYLIPFVKSISMSKSKWLIPYHLPHLMKTSRMKFITCGTFFCTCTSAQLENTDAQPENGRTQTQSKPSLPVNPSENVVQSIYFHLRTGEIPVRTGSRPDWRLHLHANAGARCQVRSESSSSTATVCPSRTATDLQCLLATSVLTVDRAHYFMQLPLSASLFHLGVLDSYDRAGCNWKSSPVISAIPPHFCSKACL